ncbi:hypothetical protein GOP47_0024692 [Adiantum capillus-veneris]|uniref:Protein DETOXIFICATION n=1 Tax=Adiantum capillus-veneris TaxID=13818 RepID=A0A9D4U2Q9_ADICA|nr:hypothetical protein GOP47_0024692 [Adiantum capillus-veneris]
MSAGPSLLPSVEKGTANNTRFNGELDFAEKPTINPSFNGEPDFAEKPTGWISSRLSPRWLIFWQEVKLQCHLAGPLIAVSLLQMAFQIIAIMFVGHLGELALSSSSIATSVANVTGMCVMMGMASSLETLCGQAFGAKQYRLIGLYLQTGLIVLNILAVFLSFIYGYMGEVLIALGQDEQISLEAGKYAKYLIPTLFAHASSQTLIRFLQTQSLVYPMLVCSGLAAAIHVPLCWLLVYKTSLGFTGAALSTSICNWISVILLYGYIIFSPSCSLTRAPLSLQSLKYMGSFFKLALPSAAMLCLEWWCYEILVLLSGLLQNPELQTSTLSICLNFANITFQIPFGLGVTVSTRVSNELGAGRPQAAYRAVLVGETLTEIQACIVSILVLSFHRVLGHVFSGDSEVIEAVSGMLKLLAISSFLDSNQAVLSGIARGCGWQALGAFINLSSFYIVALPVGACLGFLTPLQARGLWIGVICGPFVQVCLLGLMTWTAKWDKEVSLFLLRMIPSSKLLEQ